MAPLLAVLGEGLAVVIRQLDSPLSTVIYHLNCSCSDKVSELDVVQASIPLGGGQGQPVSRHFQDEQFPGVGSNEVPQLSLLSQLGKVGSPKCVSFGFSGDKSDCYPGLVIILQILTGEGEQEQDSAVLGAWN